MRDEFPIFKNHPELIYLDSAATAHKPRKVLEALNQFYSEHYATVHRAAYRSSLKATEMYNETRETAARFLNAEVDEIVFTRGTTSAINLVAQSYGKTFLKSGDEILVTEMEHHSNLVPWQMLAKATGATLRYIPIDDLGNLIWESTLTAKTKLVAVAHISNVTGTINPIEEMAKAAHKVGAVLVVDGAQAAPHLHIDVKALGCDFYAFSGHKCYGPTGVGVLFGKKELLECMPPIEGGGDMIEEVTLDWTTYQKPPLRFEAGTPMIGSVIALKAALEFTKEHIGFSDFLPYATQRLREIEGVKIIGEALKKGPILTFIMEGIHPLDIASYLDLKQIAIRSGHLCAQPLLKRFGLKAAARISFGVYNTESEIDQVMEALHAASTILHTRK